MNFYAKVSQFQNPLQDQNLIFEEYNQIDEKVSSVDSSIIIPRVLIHGNASKQDLNTGVDNTTRNALLDVEVPPISSISQFFQNFEQVPVFKKNQKIVEEQTSSHLLNRVKGLFYFSLFIRNYRSRPFILEFLLWIKLKHSRKK